MTYIDYTEYLAENINKSIDYTEYLAENINKSIDYTEYIAQNINKSIDYTEYIAQNLGNYKSKKQILQENRLAKLEKLNKILK